MINTTQNTGVDFTKGQWLINTFDSPSSVYEPLTKKSTENFSTFLGDRLHAVNSVKGIILPKKTPINPTKKELEIIKKGCADFDYFINIKAGVNKDQIAGIDFTPSHFRTEQSNEGEIIIEIYDLNHAEIIFSQKAIGRTATSNSSISNDVEFSKTTPQLIMGAYKKIMKNIDKNSIKN